VLNTLITTSFVKNTSIQGNNLVARCVRSSFILGVSVVISKGLSFLSKVILARLLVPQELGLMVLILSITALFESLTEVGIKQSVIQNKNGAQPEYLNVAWWFQSIRGIGLYLIGFFLTPFLCRFYFADKPEVLAIHTNQELVILIRIAFLSTLFIGFVSPRAHILEKEFRFGRAAILSQGSTALGAVLTILLAFVIRNVWALVIGFAVTGLIGCLLSYTLCPFWPRMTFNRSSFQEVSRFARGMVGLPILTYIAYNIDVLVGGKLVPTYLLGMYGFAQSLALMPRELFVRIISPILLPAFAEKQHDKEAMCRAVLKITKFTALFGIPLAIIAAVFSKSILSLVYRPDYSAVAIPFGLLCFYVMLLTQSNTPATIFLGIGQPAKHRTFVAVRALISVAFMYPAVKMFGLTGAVVIVLLANLVALMLQVVVVGRLIGLRVRDYIMAWLPGVALALPVSGVCLILRFI
jgi:O-antigen/teichoic acid export membrane protein